ncbi:MAG: hypothetical protein AB7F59_02615 [Bdellovibrionales bacterium]
MKSIMMLSLILVANNALAQLPKDYRGPQQRALFLDLPEDRNLRYDLVNTYNNSALYALTINGTINGSGDQFFAAPAEAQGLVDQAIRVMSLFDLYFTHRVKELENQYPAGGLLRLTAAAARQGLIDRMPKLELNPTDQSLGQWLTFIAPAFQHNVKSFNEKKDFDPVFKEQLFNGMNDALQRRFPHHAPRGPEDQIPYALGSLEPIYFENRLALHERILVPMRFRPSVRMAQASNLYEKRSSLRHTMYFPSPGILDTSVNPKDPATWFMSSFIYDLKKQGGAMVSDPLVIDRVSLNEDRYEIPTWGAPRMMRVQLEKDFRKQDELGLSLEFGNLAKPVAHSPHPQMDFSDANAALLARGYIHLQNPKLSWLNSNLNKYKVDLVIHKVYLRLKRPAMSWDEALNKKYPTFETIEMDPQLSRVSAVVRIKKEDIWLSDLITVFGSEIPYMTCKKDLSGVEWCSRYLPNYELLTNFITKEVSKSANAQVKPGIEGANKSIIAASLQIMGQIEAGRTLVQRLLPSMQSQ